MVLGAGVRGGLGSGVCKQGTGGGTCTLVPCLSHRGPTVCVRLSSLLIEKTCICKPGYCMQHKGFWAGYVCTRDERIPASCEVNVGDKCTSNSSCSGHGTAFCGSVDQTCTCDQDSCLGSGGVCRSKSWGCDKDTGGTCAIFGCKASRGPTECFSDMCLCKSGYCHDGAGKCVDKANAKMLSSQANLASSSTLTIPRSFPPFMIQSTPTMFGWGCCFCLIALVSAIIRRRRRGDQVVSEYLLLAEGE